MADCRVDDTAGQTWRAAAFGECSEVLNGIFYVLWTGCQWKALPKDLPPKRRSTITSNSGTGMARWSGYTELLKVQLGKLAARYVLSLTV